MILPPFLIKYQEDLVCRILSFSSQPHILSTKLAASWPQVWDILHFRGNHFPTKLANFVSIRISDSQVLLHFRVYFNLFLSIPDDNRNNNLKLKSLLNLAKLAMFGFHLKYYTFQLWGTTATTKASNFLLKSFYRHWLLIISNSVFYYIEMVKCLFGKRMNLGFSQAIKLQNGEQFGVHITAF